MARKKAFRKFTSEHTMKRRGQSYIHYRDYHGRFTSGKYRKQKPSWTTTMPQAAKQIAAYGTHHGKNKRVQMKGTGRQLFEAMQLVARHPPKKQFLTVSTEDLLDDPEEYLESGMWDDRPKIYS